ncbi:MAG: hypothetical protein ABMA02_04980 [Saprospiraceae bacterium]
MRYLLLFAFFAGHDFGFAQKLYPLQSIADSLAFRLVAANRLPALQWLAPPDAVVGAKRGDYPEVAAIFLRESDLVVQYAPGRSAAEQSFTIELALYLPDGSRIEPLPHERAENTNSANSDQRELVWLDVLEHLPEFEGPYGLYIRRSLMGAVNCTGERPVFSLKKQLPHYAAAGAGLALVGLGQVYNQQKIDAYAQYRAYWADGKSRDEAEDPFLKTAEDKKKAAEMCTYVGLALLGADAVWYALRAMKIKRRQKAYDKFCAPPSTSLLQVRPTAFPTSALPGVGFSITFSLSRP